MKIICHNPGRNVDSLQHTEDQAAAEKFGAEGGSANQESHGDSFSVMQAT